MRLENWLYTLRSRLRSIFRRSQVEDELDEEIRDHVERQVHEHISKGLRLEEAQNAALRAVGSIEIRKEQCRDTRRMTPLEDLMQDLRYGLRVLRRSPGFSAAALLSLGLGIGANTAIFSVIDALLLRPLPVKSPERLVRFVNPTKPDIYFAYSQFERFRDSAQLFSGISLISVIDRTNVTLGGVGGGPDPAQVAVALVSGDYFSTLGVDVALGRTMTADDDRVPGGHPVAVISYGYWERRFAKDPLVIGRTFLINGTTYSILGVTPKGFSGDWVGRPVDLWIPMMMQPQVMPERTGGLQRWGGFIVGRLKPGVTMQHAQAAAQLLYQQLLREQAGANPTSEAVQQILQQRLELEPGARGYSPQRRSFAQPLVILLMVVGLVLLIACANVANLLLARSAARHKEMAVRLAIGARSWRIVRQLLTESILLATVGGILGLLFSGWATHLLVKSVHTGYVGFNATSLSVDLDLNSDARIFAFTASLCLLTGVLFGLAPAFRGSKVSLSSSLTGRSGASLDSGGRFGLGKALVISQVAASLLLLATAGLFLRTLSNLKSQDLAIDQEHVLLIWTAPMQAGLTGNSIAPLFETVRERLSSVTGVVSASASVYGLLNGNTSTGPAVSVQGYKPKPGEDPRAQVDLVAPGYFQTLGMPLLLGRDFNAADTETAPRVAIINENMAHHFFGDENPIGKHFGEGMNAAGTEVEIVGVVGGGKQVTPRDQQRMMFYKPYRQDISHLLQMCVVMRTAAKPTSIIGRVRQELRDLDPGLPVVRIDTIEEQLNDLLVPERLIAQLSTFLAALAMLLACLGLYGVISYTVARRTNEIGIRMAMGATRANVLTMVLKESFLLVVAGIAIGLPSTLASARLISSRLFGVTPADPITISGATLLMIAVAALAAFLPAVRAARVAPMVTLRYE